MDKKLYLNTHERIELDGAIYDWLQTNKKKAKNNKIFKRGYDYVQRVYNKLQDRSRKCKYCGSRLRRG